MNNIIETFYRKLVRIEAKRRYHQASNKEAEKILRSIKNERGILNPHFKKLSEEYAQDVFGNKHFAPWLNVYAETAETFKTGWIPDNYYGFFVVPYKSSFYGIMSSGIKSLTQKLLTTSCLPDIAYYVSGLFFTSSWEVIPIGLVSKYLFSSNDKIVYKEDNSYQGKGIYIFTQETFSTEKIQHIGNGVFQSYIEQHHFFNEIMPESVATLRLTTVIEDDGTASCRAAMIRFGRKDDCYCKWAADIKIPVNIQTGQLNEKGYMPDWRTLFFHPDTLISFEGKEIPKFEACVDHAKQWHLSVPFTRAIGWDLIVNGQEEIQLMELNGGHNDIKFSEATQGPCFADMGWEKLWKERKTHT